MFCGVPKRPQGPQRSLALVLYVCLLGLLSGVDITTLSLRVVNQSVVYGPDLKVSV